VDWIAKVFAINLALVVVVTGGLHWIEHVLYFSTTVIHLVVPSHPIHVIFHLCFAALAAGTTHTGYGDLLVKGRPAVGLGDFFHQVHHRYFDCNYGNATMPWDSWFGSFHDGTPEATARLRQRQARLRGADR
jgi:Delta7-sterol 5-desaturase